MTNDTETIDDESGESPATTRAGDDDPTDGDARTDGGHDSPAASDQTSDGGVIDGNARDVHEYLLKGALVMLVVLGVVATLQFYVHAQTAIGRLVASDYRPLFLAGFNLAVLLAVGIGIAQAVRRLGGSAGE